MRDLELRSYAQASRCMVQVNKHRSDRTVVIRCPSTAGLIYTVKGESDKADNVRAHLPVPFHVSKNPDRFKSIDDEMSARWGCSPVPLNFEERDSEYDFTLTDWRCNPLSVKPLSSLFSYLQDAGEVAAKIINDPRLRESIRRKQWMEEWR